jgi:uncharacterized membrane protein
MLLPLQPCLRRLRMPVHSAAVRMLDAEIDALAVASSIDALAIAPSGVNGLPLIDQAGVFALSFVAIGIGAIIFDLALRALERALPPGWFSNWRATWPILGLIFMAAGSAHFTAHAAFESIYPPLGTWYARPSARRAACISQTVLAPRAHALVRRLIRAPAADALAPRPARRGFWELPGSAEFHVAWTGVAEIAGGAGLTFGAIASAFGLERLRWLKPTAAACLVGLTLAVTPANVYMFTHGANMVGLPGVEGDVPVMFHYARAVMQALILALLVGIVRADLSTEAEMAGLE